MNILYVARLTDSKLKEKLVPLLQSPQVTHVYVLRDAKGVDFNDKVSYLFPKKKIRGVFRHIFKIFKGIYYCRKYNIDIVIGVLNTPHGYIGKTISFFAHLPYIHITIAGHREFWIDGKLEETVNCWLFKQAAFVMVTGSQTRKYLLKKNFDSSRVVMLPNIPDEIFLNMASVPMSQNRQYDIVFMSRIDKNKNLCLLLKALSILKTEQKIQTLIVGDGEELQEMRLLANSLGINDSVCFSGYVSGIKEKIDIYESARIFVSCSKGEGFPVSLLEAMSCGCVPVISNVGDVADVIKQGVNGYLFDETDDETELAGYLQQLFEDDTCIDAISREAQKIRTKISIGNNTRIWDGVFSKIRDKK